jgi:hypothetical protein
VKPLEQLLSVLDAVSEDEIILVPNTNSLLAASDPIEHRKVSGENSFVFMILPTVLGELDRLKVEHRNPDVREKAKKVITWIKGWRNQGPLAKGVTVDKTITVKALHTEPNMKATLSGDSNLHYFEFPVAEIMALIIVSLTPDFFSATMAVAETSKFVWFVLTVSRMMDSPTFARTIAMILRLTRVFLSSTCDGYCGGPEGTVGAGLVTLCAASDCPFVVV